MKNQLYAIIETLKTLKIDPVWDNADRWVGCVIALQRIADELEEMNTDGKSSD